MNDESFKHRLDLYYLSTIGYLLAFVAYVGIRGTVASGTFEVVLRDPVVYVLAGCALVSIVALITTAILARTVIIRDDALLFRSRFKTKVLHPQDISWIAFRRERRASTRGLRAYPAIVIQRTTKRRKLRLRPGNFENAIELARTIRDWAQRNGVQVRVRKRPGGAPTSA
jgi:hypothetical protein